MPATSAPGLWTGSIVVDAPTNQIYKVAKVNPANIKCIAADGKLWNISRARLRAATPEEQETFKSAEPATPLKPLRMGHVVRFTGDYARKHGADLMIVLKVKPGDLISIVRLGGDVRHRYFPSVPQQSLELVDGPVGIVNV